METITLPNDLKAELESYADAKNVDESTAIRKLVAEGLDDWRTKQALERLEAGEVTLSRAAEVAEMNVWKVAARANEESVTLVSDDHLETDLEDL